MKYHLFGISPRDTWKGTSRQFGTPATSSGGKTPKPRSYQKAFLAAVTDSLVTAKACWTAKSFSVAAKKLSDRYQKALWSLPKSSLIATKKLSDRYQKALWSLPKSSLATTKKPSVRCSASGGFPTLPTPLYNVQLKRGHDQTGPGSVETKKILDLNA